MGAEIISADSRQIYQGMAIGTAQPSFDELARVRHHLVSVLPPSESYSVARFCSDALAILKRDPHKPYLLVGGTGMYVQALHDGLSNIPSVDPAVRERLLAVSTRKGLPFLYRWMIQVDPVLRSSIQPGDSHRILRALEIHCQTGLRWSDLMNKKAGGLGPFPIAWLDRERAELYSRIDERIQAMMNSGWLKEVELLYTQCSVQTPGMQSLGYRNLSEFLLHGGDLPKVIAQIQQETRNFAKRQLTWFRHQLPSQNFTLPKSGEFDQISLFEDFFKKNARKP
jgi:tRNA dimethylallyltransferase